MLVPRLAWYVCDKSLPPTRSFVTRLAGIWRPRPVCPMRAPRLEVSGGVSRLRDIYQLVGVRAPVVARRARMDAFRLQLDWGAICWHPLVPLSSGFVIEKDCCVYSRTRQRSDVQTQLEHFGQPDGESHGPEEHAPKQSRKVWREHMPRKIRPGSKNTSSGVRHLIKVPWVPLTGNSIARMEMSGDRKRVLAC